LWILPFWQLGLNIFAGSACGRDACCGVAVVLVLVPTAFEAAACIKLHWQNEWIGLKDLNGTARDLALVRGSERS
jgi:hypothetical protein